jgi:cyanate permease
LGPGLVGTVRDWTGGYDAALALCIALELLAAAIIVQRGRLNWRPAAANSVIPSEAKQSSLLP